MNRLDTAEQGFGRVLVLILVVIIMLAVFHVDVRGYIGKIWSSYISPFLSGEVFSGIGEKALERNTLPEE